MPARSQEIEEVGPGPSVSVLSVRLPDCLLPACFCLSAPFSSVFCCLLWCFVFQLLSSFIPSSLFSCLLDKSLKFIWLKVTESALIGQCLYEVPPTFDDYRSSPQCFDFNFTRHFRQFRTNQFSLDSIAPPTNCDITISFIWIIVNETSVQTSLNVVETKLLLIFHSNFKESCSLCQNSKIA